MSERSLRESGASAGSGSGAEPPRLCTIGYQAAGLEDVLNRLRARGVTLLVDVRDSPRSRKRGFAKRALAEALAANGIAYEHWKELGAPPVMRRALRESGEREAFFAAYRERLAERDEVLEALAGRLSEEVGCLLCFEREPSVCHRSLVAERMVRRRLVGEVEHLEP